MQDAGARSEVVGAPDAGGVETEDEGHGGVAGLRVQGGAGD